MSATSILPTYQRFVNGVPVSFSRRSFKAKEKYVIFLVFATFGLVCFGTFFFLPSSTTDSVYNKVYDQIKRAGPDLLIPPPPHLENSREATRLLRHNEDVRQDPHIYGDRQKLKAKIEEDQELKVLERPDMIVVPRRSSPASPVMRGRPINAPQIEVDSKIDRGEEVGVQMAPQTSGFNKGETVPPAPADRYPLIQGGEDKSVLWRERRDTVKQMMKHAWDNYVRYAWGKNELKPISKKGHQGSVFGSQPLGATILDGLDSLYIMGLNEEFSQAKDWVVNEFDVDEVVADVSVFEVNIRFVAGLLSCFALTGETIFRDKAKQIADKLLPAFNTPTGIPHALVNFRTGASRNYGWASSSSSILSEFGTLHMEFSYLSDVTGIPIYRNKVDKIRHVLQQTEKPNGLYPNYLNPRTGRWGQHHMSMGALGDSFYEYLLKVWVQSNKEDVEAREMFDESMQAVFKHMLFTSPGGLTYFAERKFDRVEHKMDHLACFAGGLLGLASRTLSNELSHKYMDVAKQITNTCHESYDRSFTKLGPESFRFTVNLTDLKTAYIPTKDFKVVLAFNEEGSEARALKSSEKYYILRPEVIEAYFYMWRLTKDEKYREWAWEAAQAIEKYCRTPSGYTGIKNVYSEEPIQDDVQQSFFLAETLKYLYLIFSDDKLLSLDEWVFNTEAHPFPIKGINPFYREAA